MRGKNEINQGVKKKNSPKKPTAIDTRAHARIKFKKSKKNRDKKTTYTPFFPSFQNFDLYRLVQEIVRFFRRLHFKKTNKASCGVKYHSFVEIHVLWSNSKYTEITESLQGKLTFH